VGGDGGGGGRKRKKKGREWREGRGKRDEGRRKKRRDVGF